MPSEDEDGWDFDTETVGEETEESDTEDDEEEWRFSLEDLEDENEDDIDADGDDQSAVGGNVFGSFNSDTEIIEAGKPTRENVLFVLVGVGLALLVFYQFYLFITAAP